MAKVMIVDDNEQIRKVVRRLLIKKGYETLEAKDGPEALLVLETETPLVILLDMMMPGMLGSEVCQKIREDPRHDNAYIIILSAKAKSEDKVMGLDSGADDYISKPFLPEELISRIEVGLRTVGKYKQKTQGC